MVALYIKKILHNMNCVTGVWFRELGQVAGLVRNFNIGIFFDTINIINVKLGMVVQQIELYQFITLSVTLTLFQGHSSIKQF